MRSRIGSQWSLNSKGVMWQCLPALYTSLAAAFCTLWIFWIWASGSLCCSGSRSSETSACRPTSVWCLKEKQKLHVMTHKVPLKILRARQDCVRTSRKTDFRQKSETSAGLKITFMDLTYPGQHPELPSLSHHFLLYKRQPSPCLMLKISIQTFQEVYTDRVLSI